MKSTVEYDQWPFMHASISKIAKVRDYEQCWDQSNVHQFNSEKKSEIFFFINYQLHWFYGLLTVKLKVTLAVADKKTSVESKL